MRSDVVIVLKHTYDTFDVVTEISGHPGTTIHDVYPDLGVIEATLASEHVAPLHQHAGVSYIRPIHSYSEVAA
jgi:hypothetical protein